MYSLTELSSYAILTIICCVQSLTIDECSTIELVNEDKLLMLSKIIVPSLNGKVKGESGRIGVIGGSVEYTGAPYFSAISSMLVGADLVYVITTASAAPIIKFYSPDLIVYPYLNSDHIDKIKNLLKKMDVIIIGPGLGREQETLQLVYSIIENCKLTQKPLVIDADGLYAISKNITIIKDYPIPGAILTPNFREAQRLKEKLNIDNNGWMNYWGKYVSTLVKGPEDEFYSSNVRFNWSKSYKGSGRRVGGQGDILSGALGTFYNWALKANICDDDNAILIAQSLAANAAARLTRRCNSLAYAKYGRSMLASNMLQEIHIAFDGYFS